MKVLDKPIEVISLTKKDGSTNPIKFRLSDENGEIRSYKIATILKTDKDKIAGKTIYRYTCKVIINDIEKLCEIRYCRDTMLWTLYKI